MEFIQFINGITIIILLIVLINYNTKTYKVSEYYRQTHNSILKVFFNKGLRGEYKIWQKLSSLPGYKKFVFNTYLPKANSTTEIDVIMIYKSGIYVIESKNYRGWIYGAENNKYWTQVIKSGNKRKYYNKYKFYNPIWQNNSHVNTLKDIIGSDYNIKSVIIFGEYSRLKDVPKTNNKYSIDYLNNAYKKLENDFYNTENIIKNEEIDKIFNRLFPYSQISKTEKKKHIQNIQNKHE